MRTSYDTLKMLIRTEKGTFLKPQRKYFFQVDQRATKIDVKKAVEEIYKVKVQGVRTMIFPGKPKVVRHQLGYTSRWKKAVVTLKEGNTIEVA